MRQISITLFLCTFLSMHLCSQSSRWQQKAEYKMAIDFDVKKHQFKGTQAIKYHNNSPDTLTRIFYHLFFNAFQPESMMDVHSRTIEDPDKRVGDRISKLTSEEMGYHQVKSLKVGGQAVNFEVEGTILEVDVPSGIKPGQKVALEMEFEGQVPLQIRRSGRDSKEGISYSMTQWYPKLCEYDYQGWHANPYVGREFHGVWGDFDVTIAIDRKYTVAASGLLQDMKKMGHGYSDKNTKKKGLFKKKKLKWRFVAENVHDFAWAADPDYTHYSKVSDAGTVLRYLYQENDKTQENWEKLHDVMNVAEKFMNKKYGEYPYPTYAFIQGGDGGMEYPMATLITGERSFTSLVGVAIHEWMHSWYQMVLGTNEALYPWMDEGFTSYASAEVMNYLREEGLIPGEASDNPHFNTVRGYARFSQSGKEEALSTHADHYVSNSAYGVGSYTKGSVFLSQLKYIVGEKDFNKSMLRYFDEWKYKHPNPNDFIRVVEKTSDLELDWFREYWVNTIHTIDYGIESVTEENGQLAIKLIKKGRIPMPLDVTVFLADGSKRSFYIPTRIMRGEKKGDTFKGEKQADWPWTHTHYLIKADLSLADVSNIIIDESRRLADIDLTDNYWPSQEEAEK